jgi:hypothetical protein
MRTKSEARGQVIPLLSNKSQSTVKHRWSNQIIIEISKILGMHRISGRPDNPAFFDIRYPAGYQIALPDIRPDTGYRISGLCLADPIIYLAFLQIRHIKMSQKFI